MSFTRRTAAVRLLFGTLNHADGAFPDAGRRRIAILLVAASLTDRRWAAIPPQTVPELIVRAEKSFFQPVAFVRPLGVPEALCNKHKDRFMANTSSAKKAARQMIRRTEVNKGRRTRVKSEVRSVEEAIVRRSCESRSSTQIRRTHPGAQRSKEVHAQENCEPESFNSHSVSRQCRRDAILRRGRQFFSPLHVCYIEQRAPLGARTV